MILLVGDIGGTNARFALISPELGTNQPLARATLPSRRYGGLEELVTDFLAGRSTKVDRAVLAVAAPVIDGRARPPNLGWEVGEEELRRILELESVRLVNDLVALAHAVPHLVPGSVRTVQAGVPEAGGTLAVVAPGTGLGEAFLLQDGTGYRAHPSEGGHADFAPADGLQRELLARLSAGGEHVSYERVCSGRGIAELFAFLRERRDWPEEEWLAERLSRVDDPTPLIVEAALDAVRPSALCAATVELFAAILAAEAGNVALRVLATGGVYLAGGLPRRLVPVLQRPAFLTRFRAKGRMAPLLDRIPLHVVTAPDVALLGAAHLALADLTTETVHPGRT